MIIMRIFLNIFNLSLMFVVIAQTSCSGQSIKNRVIKPDNTVVSLWGNTICNIIFSPTKVNCYTLRPLEKPDGKTKTVGNFVVDKTIGKIAKWDYSILQFILQDGLNYRNDSIRNKCPFTPYLAFEFINKKESVTVLLSFNCEDWGVVYKGNLRQAGYDCTRQMLQFAKYILPDDEYLKSLTDKN
jgi:hypothetical protein